MTQNRKTERNQSPSDEGSKIVLRIPALHERHSTWHRHTDLHARRQTATHAPHSTWHRHTDLHAGRQQRMHPIIHGIVIQICTQADSNACTSLYMTSSYRSARNQTALHAPHYSWHRHTDLHANRQPRMHPMIWPTLLDNIITVPVEVHHGLAATTYFVLPSHIALTRVHALQCTPHSAKRSVLWLPVAAPQIKLPTHTAHTRTHALQCTFHSARRSVLWQDYSTFLTLL
jgi:hypothetical protein